jgi:Fe-S-cluster containining protein
MVTEEQKGHFPSQEGAELVREVMKIGPTEMPNLTPEQRICVGCQECCRYLTFIIGEDIVNLYSEIYKVRGCTIRRMPGSLSYALRVPSVCPHLTEHGCDIYEERPQHCREYDGTMDPFMQDLCKLINFRRG